MSYAEKEYEDNRTQKELAADGQKSAQQAASGLKVEPRRWTTGDIAILDGEIKRIQKSTRDPEFCVQPGDWLNSLSSAERKKIPLGTVMREYFPDALALVAYHSWMGNEKHNPGERLHWARGKSADQEDCIARHLIGAGGRDPADGLRHSAGLAWRALALLQLEIEKAHAAGEEVL